ncbi:hypothetical protein [Bradyrhizobium sp.]|uniref:hypothetical protein n=1 Tax=Bradyrhizobium sp. TaxID=376 RepID=UPI0025C3D5F9|nr:hypothetical protein [Bradyrhizobium sp.]
MVTADSSGTPLGGCDVELYHAATDTVVGRTTSDPVGAFTFDLGNNSDFYYIRAYKAGTPDVAGTTVNTLMAI